MGRRSQGGICGEGRVEGRSNDMPLDQSLHGIPQDMHTGVTKAAFSLSTSRGVGRINGVGDTPVLQGSVKGVKRQGVSRMPAAAPACAKWLL